MKNIKKATDAIRKELKEPLPDHQPEKEKKVATKKKGKKASKKKSKKVSKKVTKRVAKKGKKKGAKKAAKKTADGTSLAELAKEAGVSGQKARQMLRKAGVEREAGSRWVFTGKADLKAARKALGL